MNALARACGIAGALLGAASVALSAWAGHSATLTADPANARRIGIALALAFVHALFLLALAQLARAGGSLLLAISAGAALLGSALFTGSLVARALFGWSSAAAPVGGLLLIAAWLALAAWFAGVRTR